MKKIISIISAIALIFATLTMVSCKDDSSTSEQKPIIMKIEDGVLTSYALSQDVKAYVTKNDYDGLAKFLNEKDDTADYTKASAEDMVKNFVVPESVTKIATNALNGLSYVESIKVGSNVTEIESGAFSGLVGLKSIELPFVGSKKDALNDKAMFGYIFGTATGSDLTETAQTYNDGNGSKTFYIPTALKTVVINSAVVEKTETVYYIYDEDDHMVKVEEGTEGASSFTSVTYEGIKPYAFNNCTMIESVTVTGNMTLVPENLFKGCTALKSFDFDGITKIKAHAFDGCTALKFDSLQGVSEIGDYAFNGCTALGSYTLEKDHKTVKLNGKLGAYAFAGCSALTDIDITTVTELGDYCFKNCSALIVDDTHVIGLGDYANGKGNNGYYFTGCKED